MLRSTTLLLGMFLFAIGFSAQAFPPGSQSAKAPVKGEILELQQVDNYSYLRLKTATGETWAAVPKTPTLKKGAKVEVHNPMVMNGFDSKGLKRKFDTIVFGTLDASAAKSTGAGMGMGMAGHGMGGGKSKLGPIPFSKIKVAKAEGADGRTISEIYGQKAALKGKPVAVRGKVVKFSGGIMGLNWIHLHDGTGKEADKNFDITVTTKDMATVGDIVLVKGIVHADKDLGSGYFYPVLVEEAKVTK